MKSRNIEKKKKVKPAEKERNKKQTEVEQKKKRGKVRRGSDIARDPWQQHEKKKNV